MGMTSTSAVMLCLPQKSSISCVSGIPPIGEPERLLRRTDKGDVAVTTEQVDIGVDVVLGGDSVEDEVEAAGLLLHLVGMAGNDDFVGPEAERVVRLVG